LRSGVVLSIAGDGCVSQGTGGVVSGISAMLTLDSSGEPSAASVADFTDYQWIVDQFTALDGQSDRLRETFENVLPEIVDRLQTASAEMRKKGLGLLGSQTMEKMATFADAGCAAAIGLGAATCVETLVGCVFGVLSVTAACHESFVSHFPPHTPDFNMHVTLPDGSTVTLHCVYLGPTGHQEPYCTVPEPTESIGSP